jgi:hypothetical protein
VRCGLINGRSSGFQSPNQPSHNHSWAATHEMGQIRTEANEGNEVGRSSFSSFASAALSGCWLVGQPVDGARTPNHGWPALKIGNPIQKANR